MNILVTGATGFIGGHLVRALVNEGYFCRCIVRKTSNLEELKRLNVELFYGDITENELLQSVAQDIDVVYHLAGQVGKWGISEEQFYKTNVTGTKNLLEECRKSQVTQFIYCSTPGVLGFGVKACKEDSNYNPRRIYEKTKCEAEKLVLHYYKTYSLPVTIIRPDFVYGPGDLRRLELYRRIARKRFIMIGNGNSYVHPTYIADLIQGFLFVIGNEKAIGNVYNIAGPNQVTVREYLHTIAEILGVNGPKFSIPRSVAKFFALFTENMYAIMNKEPLLTTSKIDFLTINHGSDISKARNELGYVPRYSLKDGLKETIQWYKAHKLL